MLVKSNNSAFPLLSEQIPELEKAMLQLPQVSCPVIHRFGPGIYIREVFIPAGTFAIGHHQNFEHLNIMLKGKVSVLNDDGSISELKAPLIFVGKPGRKVGFIHEDIVWLNVYSTNETDVEKLESHFITKSDEWTQNNLLHLENFKADINKADYLALLNEFGFTEEKAREQSENTSDFVELPHGGYKIKTGKSSIEGKGLFATADIAEGEIIAPARINGKRTIAGRFANHSLTPNAHMVRGFGDDINLVAIRNISGCTGGNDGEEITVNYRDSLRLTMLLGRG